MSKPTSPQAARLLASLQEASTDPIVEAVVGAWRAWQQSAQAEADCREWVAARVGDAVGRGFSPVAVAFALGVPTSRVERFLADDQRLRSHKWERFPVDDEGIVPDYIYSPDTHDPLLNEKQ